MDHLISSCNEEIVNRILQILSKVATSLESELQQHVFHLIEAPESNEIDESVQPLLNFLHEQLVPYQDYLIPENYTRLLELVWFILIDQITAEIQDPNSTVRHATFFRRIER